MKKRVIHINGLGGILMTLFIVSCLIAGFIGFPALLSMMAWNFVALKVGSASTISFLGGLLLWGIIVLSYMIFHKKNMIVSFGLPGNLTKDELTNILNKAEFGTKEELMDELDKIEQKSEDKSTQD